MFNSRNFLKTLTLFLLIATAALKAHTQGLSQADIPLWVQKIDADNSDEVSQNEVSDGFYFALLDQQTDVETHSYFVHTTKKVLNATGVQNCSEIALSYNKAFERIELHRIAIIRNGQTIDKLDLQKFKVIQQENQLQTDRQYSEQMSAMLFLEDVKEGDVIDLAYTLIGDNPVFDNRFSQSLRMNFSVPVGRIFYKTIMPPQRTVQVKLRKTTLQPTIFSSDASTIYRWDVRNPKVVKLEDNLPVGYDPYGAVDLVEYDSWEDVKNWALDVYRPVLERSGSGVAQIAEKIRASSTYESDRVIASVRYVQNNIRYLGIETGVNSHLPADAETTLRLGYGDCKAKSVLLCVLLRQFNIEAYPILISTFKRGYLAEATPTPDAFDHVCVKVKFQGRPYYFDPTIAYQSGDLQHSYFANHQYGLVLDDASADLEKIPYHGMDSKVTMQQVLHMGDSNEVATLLVTTTYSGVEADIFRANWNSSSHAQFEKECANYYSKLFNRAELVDSVYVKSDDPVLNVIVVVENYRITGLWKNEKNLLATEIYSPTLGSKFVKPNTRNRMMPIGLTMPQNYEETWDLYVPMKLSVDEVDQWVTNEGFSFHFVKSYSESENLVQLKYEYHNNMEVVAPERAAAYYEDIEKAIKYMDFTIQWDRGGLTSKGISFFMIALALLFLAGAVVLMRYIYFNYNPNAQAVDLYYPSIQGWLVLPLITFFLNLPYLIYLIFSQNYFDETITTLIFEKSSLYYHPDRGYFLIFEMGVLIARVVFTGTLIVLFLNKRTSVPKLAVIWYSVGVLYSIIELVAIQEWNPSESAAFSKNLFQMMVAAAIWIPYFLISKRVKQTFVMIYTPDGNRNDTTPLETETPLTEEAISGQPTQPGRESTADFRD
ncbi:MAG: DUF3857 domain-containing protein [Chitinophagales bacterium]